MHVRVAPINTMPGPFLRTHQPHTLKAETHFGCSLLGESVPRGCPVREVLNWRACVPQTMQLMSKAISWFPCQGSLTDLLVCTLKWSTWITVPSCLKHCLVWPKLQGGVLLEHLIRAMCPWAKVEDMFDRLLVQNGIPCGCPMHEVCNCCAGIPLWAMWCGWALVYIFLLFSTCLGHIATTIVSEHTWALLMCVLQFSVCCDSVQR